MNNLVPHGDRRSREQLAPKSLIVTSRSKAISILWNIFNVYWSPIHFEVADDNLTGI